MRVLLTGSTGRLGGAFFSLWKSRPGLEMLTPTRADADLAKPEELARVLARLPFDVLVNAAAVSGLEECAEDPGLAQRVNVLAPKVMAEACREAGARMVHFSTDYVFGGETPGRKRETDPTGPVNVYGTTKRSGELEVMAACPTALVCRVSWLFGPAPPGRPSHFDNVLNRASSGEPQRLIADKFSVPTYTHDIVGWVESLLEREKSGIYHLCNAGDPESWHSYAEKICQLARQRGKLRGGGELVASSMRDATFFREKRPQHTAMLPARLISEGVATPRHWLRAAEEYLEIR